MYSTNKKALQAPIFAGAMIAIVLFVFAVTSIWSIKDVTTDSREQMDCTNSSITSGQKGACIMLTWSPFIIIGLMLAGGAYYLSGKNFGQV